MHRFTFHDNRMSLVSTGPSIIMPIIKIYFAFIDVCGLIIYEPAYISHSRLYKKPAQLRSSNLARFNIYCKGKCFMNSGAIRFKKYWTLDFHNKPIFVKVVGTKRNGVEGWNFYGRYINKYYIYNKVFKSLPRSNQKLWISKLVENVDFCLYLEIHIIRTAQCGIVKILVRL